MQLTFATFAALLSVFVVRAQEVVTLTLADGNQVPLTLIPETTTTDTSAPTEAPNKCLADCFTGTVGASNCNIEDDECICANSSLQASLLQCVTSNCPPENVEVIQAAFDDVCSAFTGLPESLTGRPTRTPTGSNAASTSGQDGPNNAASGRSFISILAAAGVGAVGVVLGAAFVVV